MFYVWNGAFHCRELVHCNHSVPPSHCCFALPVARLLRAVSHHETEVVLKSSQPQWDCDLKFPPVKVRNLLSSSLSGKKLVVWSERIKMVDVCPVSIERLSGVLLPVIPLHFHLCVFLLCLALALAFVFRSCH